MTEKQIEKHAATSLDSDGWTWWKPVKSKWGVEKDIFGVYDMVAAKGKQLRFIQLTSKNNMNKRIKKVSGFLDTTKVDIPSEVWGWNKKTNEFVIKKL